MGGRSPVLLDDWVVPGMHINAFGTDTRGKIEIDPAIFARATLVVDDVHQARTIGETQHAVAAGLVAADASPRTLGDMLAGRAPGRSDATEVTLFDATGLAFQDIVAGAIAMRLAAEHGFAVASHSTDMPRHFSSHSVRLRLSSLRITACLVVAALVLPVTAVGQAQGTVVDVATWTSLQWRSIGPARGGRSIAAAGVVARPHEYYFGATGGGLWKTTDGGVTWVPVTDGQIRSSSVGAVAVSESHPDVVYVGMGETQLRGNVMQGDGVYKSIDAGRTWTQSDSPTRRRRPHPHPPNQPPSSALGHPYGRNAERGVSGRRTAVGRGRVLFRNDQAGAVDIALDESHPRSSSRRCGRYPRRGCCRAAPRVRAVRRWMVAT
jgi:hypothetical protein